MIRLRGLPITDEEASELAQRLRANGDPNGVDVADRLDRALTVGSGLIATDEAQARVVLTVIEQWAPERLRDVARSLREFTVASAP